MWLYNWRRLWRELEGLNVGLEPWLVIGNFNCIRNVEERIGGKPRLSITMQEFNQCIDKCGLLELRHSGGSMSCTNGQSGSNRKWAKLDQALVNVFHSTLIRLWLNMII